jgi:hypothetical protein
MLGSAVYGLYAFAHPRRTRHCPMGSLSAWFGAFRHALMTWAELCCKPFSKASKLLLQPMTGS